MNIENAKKLISQLERLPDEKFDMSHYIVHTDCGTVCCIAGWASVLNGGPKAATWGQDAVGEAFDEVKTWAKRWLGLSSQDAAGLFQGLDLSKPLHEVTRSDAIAELNRMIAAEAA